MTSGFDCAAPVGGIVPKIVSSGCGFAGRYYSRNPAKNLTVAEASALAARGIGVVTVWEAAGDHAAAFTLASGRQDAADALDCAALVGQPPGSVIYFAVDFDPDANAIMGNIVPYFVGVAAGLGGRYRIGVYGSGLVCGTLKARGLVTHTWRGGAMGWRGSAGYADWNIAQGVPTDMGFGFPVDPDEAKGDDFGMWLPQPAAPGQAIPEAADLQTRLKTIGYYGGKIDGDWGKLSQAALAAYYRAEG